MNQAHTMTTDKTIEEMNRVIAIFDGWELKRGDKDHLCARHDYNHPDEGCTCHMKNDEFIKNKKGVFIDGLKYHKDWNQLHAVWDRYKKLTFADPKQEQLHSEMKSLISVAICYSDMLHVHKLLYDSIVFFTTTKQKD